MIWHEGEMFSTEEMNKIIHNELKNIEVKNKKIYPQAMSVEDAIMQMNLLGHNFFVFRNSESEDINIVYKNA